MSIREEQCNKVCRILDDVLANRPAERDSLIVAVRKAFEALELFGNSEQLPSAQPERNKGSWNVIQGDIVVCSECGMCAPKSMTGCLINRHLEPNRTNFCPNCGADMRGEKHETD